MRDNLLVVMGLLGFLLLSPSSMALEGSLVTDGQGYAIAHLGEKANIGLSLRGAPDGSAAQVRWMGPAVGAEGAVRTQIGPEPILLPIRVTRAGTGPLNVTVEAGNHTLQLSTYLLALPDIRVQLKLPGGAPTSTLHLNPANTTSFMVEATNRGHLSFTGTLTWGPRAWSIDLDPNETVLLNTSILSEESNGIVTYWPGIMVADEQLALRDDDGERYTLKVVPHREVLLASPPVVAEFSARLTGERLTVQAEALGLDREVPLKVRARAWFAGPPLGCQELPVVEEGALVAGYQRWTVRDLVLDWGCQTPVSVEIILRDKETGLTVAREEDVVMPAEDPVPKVSIPSRIELDKPLPAPPGWQPVLWPASGDRLGPAYGKLAFTDEDRTARWPGTYGLWLIHDDKAVKVGEVEVEGTPWHLGLGLLPPLILLATLPLTRWP